MLGIDRDGNYYLNKQPISKTAIEGEIKRIFEKRESDKVMYLKADKDLLYSKVVDATDMAAKNGVRVIGLISDQKAGTVSTVVGDSKAPGSPTAPPGGKP